MGDELQGARLWASESEGKWWRGRRPRELVALAGGETDRSAGYGGVTLSPVLLLVSTTAAASTPLGRRADQTPRPRIASTANTPRPYIGTLLRSDLSAGAGRGAGGGVIAT